MSAKVRIRPDARPYGMQAVDLLATLAAGVEVRFHPSLPEHSRRLLETLGVQVVLDDAAPTHCCFKPSRQKKLTRAERTRSRDAYLIAIDGSGEYEHDFTVLVIEADSPRAAVERITAPEWGYGKSQDGVAYVAPLDAVTTFRVNDTTRKVVAPAELRDVVSGMDDTERRVVDPDGALS